MTHKIVVFSKLGCHLCEQAIENLKALSSRKEFQLEIVDITQDQELLKTYMIRIPVIRLDERDVLDAEDIALPSDSRSKLEGLVLKLQE